MVESQETCPTCGGSGHTISKPCSVCKGEGYTKKKVDLAVHIPAGISSGQQIFVSGKGDRGYNGGPNGDLYVEIVVKPHEFFTRQGNDIHVNVPLDFVDAILGTTIEVPTVYGTEKVNVAAGTQPNSILKMKDKGVKDLRTTRPGDQYVHLQIKTPTNLTKEQKELLEKFRGTQSDPKKKSFFRK